MDRVFSTRPGPLLSHQGRPCRALSSDELGGATVEQTAPPKSCHEWLHGCVDAAAPWALAALLGLLTATTALFIAINSDFLSDLRFGTCHGLTLSDRNRCCGGADNIDHSTERCRRPALEVEDGFKVVEWIPWEDASSVPFLVYLGVSVALSASSAILVHDYAPAAKGSGIPDAKAAVSGFSVAHRFSEMTLLVKAVGLSLVVGGGLALGKEGPLIQIGVCWAFMVRNHGKWLGNVVTKLPLDDLVCVGAAAGVSAAFGAPVGGVLFAVEELGSVHSLSQRALLLAFAASFSASFMLKGWNLNGSNQITVFKLSTPTNSPSKEWISWEILVFLLLGIIGGLVGSFFVYVNLHLVRLRRKQAEIGRIWFLPAALNAALVHILPLRTTRPIATEAGAPLYNGRGLTNRTLHVLEVALIALATATVNYPITRLLRLPMVEVIHGLFETCPNSLGQRLGLCDGASAHGFAANGRLQTALLLAAAVRLAQTVVTFGAMVPSGLFIPSLYVGAALGRLVGIWTLHLSLIMGNPGGSEVTVNPGAFAMVGAVAVLSGFARMTVSLVVIMLELTGELNYAVPFMCAVLAAKLVGDYFTVSIYDAHGSLLGYATIEEPDQLRLAANVSDVALACTDADIVDVTQPVRVEMLQLHLEGHCQSTNVMELGASSSGNRRSSSSRPSGARELSLRLQSSSGEQQQCSQDDTLNVLVLVRRAQRGHLFVCGVIQKERLAGWLESGVAPPGSICRLSDDDVAAVDLRPLLERGVQRFSYDAPVLTAVCAFRENPRLQYCVCCSEHSDSLPSVTKLGVLSRDRLESSLASGRFAAAFRKTEGVHGS